MAENVVLKKQPREVLLGIISFLFLILAFFFNRSVAHADKIEETAFTAEKTANTALINSKQALDANNELKVQIADVRGAVETNRRENREDNIRRDQDLKSMENRIITVVKSRGLGQ